MDITPLVAKNKNIIQAYGNGYIVIKNARYLAPLAVSADEIFYQYNVNNISDLSNLYEIVLIGADRDLRVTERRMEVMSFGAACRTYNVLLAEGRKILCLLL